LTSPAIRGISYRHSQTCFLNGAALLGKPAVAPTCQTVITFENCYNSVIPANAGIQGELGPGVRRDDGNVPVGKNFRETLYAINKRRWLIIRVPGGNTAFLAMPCITLRRPLLPLQHERRSTTIPQDCIPGPETRRTQLLCPDIQRLRA
jgi:hypothetical protein